MNSKNPTDGQPARHGKKRAARWLLLPVAAGACLAAALFFTKDLSVGHRLGCTVHAAPFLETLTVSGEIDTGEFQEVRAPEAPFERQITWLAPEGAAVKKGDIVAQFDVADAQDHLDWEAGKVETQQNSLETETIRWDIDLSTEQVRKDQNEETRQNALLRKKGSVVEPPLPREISEHKFGVADLTVDQAARRIKQLSNISAVELRRRKGWIRYLESRVDRDKSYMESYVVRSSVDSVIIYPPIPLAGGVIRKVEAGDYLEREQVFARLPDFSSRVVRLKVPERSVEKVAEDARLTFQARAFPGEKFEARVVSISKLAFESTNHPNQKFFDVVAEIVPKEGMDKLNPGMVVEATFPVRDFGVVFRIPKDLATKEENGGFKLLVEKPDGTSGSIVLRKDFSEIDDYLLVPQHFLDSTGTVKEIKFLFIPKNEPG